ncbi:MAG: hypothetical protein AAB459_01820 [Patescibacteria group bacterium]
MDVYAQIAEKIIAQQESIIGPVAIEQAKQVGGLKIDWPKHEISLSGDEAKVIDNLVEKYKELFGQISVEVCKEAAAKVASQLTGDELPKSLQ